MVSGMLVGREETDWDEFLKADSTQHMWVETEVSLIAVTHSISVHGRSHRYEKAHKHLLYDKNKGNTWPVAIAVPDDMCLGELGPILWVSFLHMYNFYQEERYGFGIPVMSCLGMAAFMFMPFSFRTEDIVGMSCEIVILFLDCQFTLGLYKAWKGT